VSRRERSVLLETDGHRTVADRYVAVRV